MKKTLVRTLAAGTLGFGLVLGGSSSAQAAPVVSYSYPGCVYTSGALTCFGAYYGDTVALKPVKRIPARQAQKAYIRQLQIRLAQERVAAWNAARAR